MVLVALTRTTYYFGHDIVDLKMRLYREKTVKRIKKNILKAVEEDVVKVDQAVQEWDQAPSYKVLLFEPVGDQLYLSVEKKYAEVSLRKWEMKSYRTMESHKISFPMTWSEVEQEHLYLTKIGVPFSFTEWEQVKAVLRMITLNSADFGMVTTCNMRDDRQNQFGLLQCHICIG